MTPEGCEVDAGSAERPSASGRSGRSLRVMKFGGTSVAGADRLRRIADLVAAAAAEERALVVVSAVSGVTNLLLEGCDRAVAGEEDHALGRYRAIHASIADDLAAEIGTPARLALGARLVVLEGELARALAGIALLADCSPRVRAQVAALGERAAVELLVALLEARGLAPARLDPRQLLPCTGDPLEAVPQVEEARRRSAPWAAGAAAAPLVAVAPGFFGGDAKGDAMLLGRGGSDYSAALFAQALDARLLEIWTDVAGIFTADPRLVPAARAVAEVSFEEAMELAHFGAKVLHPKSVAPARAAGIPVRICDTLRPELPGTLVRPAGAAGERVACGLSLLDGVALLSIAGPGMKGVPGVAARAFAALAERGLSVMLITQGSSECVISLGLRDAEAERAVAALAEAFSAEIATGRVEEIDAQSGLAILSLVGDGMRHRAGVAGGLFGALGEAAVNAVAIAQGGSERSICVVIDEKDGGRAARAVHARFFEDAVAAPPAAGPVRPVSHLRARPEEPGSESTDDPDPGSARGREPSVRPPAAPHPEVEDGVSPAAGPVRPVSHLRARPEEPGSESMDDLDPGSARGREPSVRPPAAPHPSFQENDLHSGGGPAASPPERVARLRRGPWTIGGEGGEPVHGTAGKATGPAEEEMPSARAGGAPAAAESAPVSRVVAVRPQDTEVVAAFAPAGIGNLAAGFDVLGAAIAPLAPLAPLDSEAWGDAVEVRAAARDELVCVGPFAARLPADPRQNLVWRARDAVERALGAPLPPLALTLHKHLPVASGLGGSAASAVAAVVAIDAFLGGPLSEAQRLHAAGEAEGGVAGEVHLDNVAAILLGGVCLVASGERVRSLPWPDDLLFALVVPELELATREARAVLPRDVPLPLAIAHAQNLAALVHALHAGDRELLASTLRDLLAEPHRAALVPGFAAAKAAALATGALGCSLSGAGPSLFAVAEAAAAAAVGEAAARAWREAGVACRVRICRAAEGARRVDARNLFPTAGGR